MAGRTAIFDLVDLIDTALQAATTPGQPLDGVFVHDGPSARQIGGSYVFITSATEVDRDDEISLDARAYDVTYEVGLGLSYVDATGDPTQPGINAAARRALGDLVHGIADVIENDADILDLVIDADVHANAYAPTGRQDVLEWVADATITADVSVQP